MSAQSLYAVLDTARDERLYDLVMAASEHSCMFGGVVAEPLDRAAPYLVNLKSQEPLFRAWRDQGRGLAWGIMLRSHLPLGELRLHLKHFMVVKMPDGTVAQFRFYDPRVFVPYMLSCTPEELAPWFGGVSVFLAESHQTGGFHEFALEGGRLVDRAAAVIQ